MTNGHTPKNKQADKKEQSKKTPAKTPQKTPKKVYDYFHPFYSLSRYI